MVLYYLVSALYVVVCVVLLMVILLQQGKGADAGASFGSGASATVFGSQGSSTFLSKFTGILAAGFFIRPKSGNMEDAFFNKLAGNARLMEQVRKGVPEKEIRDSWQPQLDAFKKIRKKYLLYPDFE